MSERCKYRVCDESDVHDPACTMWNHVPVEDNLIQMTIKRDIAVSSLQLSQENHRAATKALHEACTKIKQFKSENQQLRKELEEAKNEIAKTFSILSVYGVPQERARRVANGIEVLVTQMDRQVQELTTEGDRLTAENKELRREITWRIED